MTPNNDQRISLRAKFWNPKVEDGYRFQLAGYKDEEDYVKINRVNAVDRWPSTGYVKKLRRQDGTFYYFDEHRECPDNEVGRVRIYERKKRKHGHDISCQLQMM